MTKDKDMGAAKRADEFWVKELGPRKAEKRRAGAGADFFKISALNL